MAERNLFSATLCCVLNNLSDFRWPPKYLRSLERHGNRGWKSWVQTVLAKATTARARCSLPVPRIRESRTLPLQGTQIYYLNECGDDLAPTEGWSDRSQNCLNDMRIVGNT